MEPKAKFDFYELVSVSQHIENDQLKSKEGPILGMAFDNEQNEWYYAVHIQGFDESWYLPESDLKSTGTILSRDDLYSGDRLSVEVGDDGDGTIK